MSEVKVKIQKIDINTISPEECIGLLFVTKDVVYNIPQTVEDVVKSNGYFGNTPCYMHWITDGIIEVNDAVYDTVNDAIGVVEKLPNSERIFAKVRFDREFYCDIEIKNLKKVIGTSNMKLRDASYAFPIHLKQLKEFVNKPCDTWPKLFTTEDGLDIYPGDEYWDRNLDNEPRKKIACVYSYDISNHSTFSTSEAAWKYIKEMEIICAENYEDEIREAALEYLHAVKSPALNTSCESFDIGIFRAGVLFAKGKDYIPK